MRKHVGRPALISDQRQGLNFRAAVRSHSRAYLHHLVKSGEILGMMLSAIDPIRVNSIAAVRAARKTLIDQRRHEVLDEIVKDDWQHDARVIG